MLKISLLEKAKQLCIIKNEICFTGKSVFVQLFLNCVNYWLHLMTINHRM